LRAAQTQANQGTQLLDNIPNIPILDASAVQNQRISFAGCLQDLKDAQNFFKAQELSTAALAANGQTVFPVAEWRSRESNLQQSIALLQSIPDTAAIHAQAKQALALDQAQLIKIRDRMRYEQEAADAFAQAQNLQSQVDRILQSQPNSEQLAEAEAKLQQAINWLKTIPGGHTVSEPSQVRLVEYQDQLAKVQYQYVISHLQPLLQDFKAFAAFVDALDVRSEAEFHDYSDRLRTLQSKFYELVQPSEALRTHPTTQTLEKALTQYHDVSELWHDCHAGQCYNSWASGMVVNRQDLTLDMRSAWWVPATYQLGGDTQSFAAKYGVKVASNLVGNQYMQVNQTIRMIWKQAEQNVQKAEEQFQLDNP
jgi:hypothetical protein